MSKFFPHFLLLDTPVLGEVDFSREIRPLLNKHCTACHGGVKEAGEVSFIYRDRALGKGESGKIVIVPGDPDASEMIARVLSSDPDEVMPKPEPGPPLAKQEVELLRKWIKEGAKWGEHWSFVAPQDHPLPEVKQVDWPKRDLDRFILELVTDPVGVPAIPTENYLLFTYRRSDLSTTAGITAACETNSGLTGPWMPATAVPGVVIQVNDNFVFTPPTSSPTDRVRVYVPRASNATHLGRIKVLIP